MPDEAWCERLRGPVAAGPARSRSARSDGQRPRRRGARFADDADDAGSAGRRAGEPVDPAVLRRSGRARARAAGGRMRLDRRLPGDRIGTAAAARTTRQAHAPTGSPTSRCCAGPTDLDVETWFTRWHVDHTPVAIETQSTFGYTQNAVVRALTPDAPGIAAIVEELFPIEATSRSARVLRCRRRRRPAATG